LNVLSPGYYRFKRTTDLFCGLSLIKTKNIRRNEAIELTMKISENLEPKLRPEYIEKIRKIEKSGTYTKFSSIKQLRDEIEKKKKG
jgi:hypothetical protein